MNGSQVMFGVNFADGQIKGYPVSVSGDEIGNEKTFHVRARENSQVTTSNCDIRVNKHKLATSALMYDSNRLHIMTKGHCNL